MRQERSILIVFIVFGVLSINSILVFVGCNKSEAFEEPNKSLVETKIIEKQIKEIRFVGQWMNEGKRGVLLRDFCREYEFKNQDVLVDLKFPEEFMDNHADRKSNIGLVCELVHKSEPAWDIIRINNQIREIATQLGDPEWAKKYLVDFSQYPEFNRGTIPQLLTEQVKEACGGIIPGPFLEGSYWALWTNKKITDKLGIEVKTKGMTIDDFISYLKVVNNYNQANPHDYIIPIHDAGDWITSFAFVFHLYASLVNNNEELFNEEITQNKLNAWKTTLLALEEISKLNPFVEHWESLKWSEMNKDILYERCLFFVNGSWMYNIWEDANADNTLNMFPAELPVFNPVNLYPSAYFIIWGVLKNSPNRDEAVKMLLAMNTPEVADMWVRYTKCPTGIKGRMTDLAFGTDQFEGFSNYVQAQYGDNIYNYSEELAKYIVGVPSPSLTYYTEVLTGKLTADQAIQMIQSNIAL